MARYVRLRPGLHAVDRAHVHVGGRFVKGLATGQRVLYARTVQARDHWVAADARCDVVDGRVFGVDGGAGVVACVG